MDDADESSRFSFAGIYVTVFTVKNSGDWLKSQHAWLILKA
jgi:hypothetical protein